VVAEVAAAAAAVRREAAVEALAVAAEAMGAP